MPTNSNNNDVQAQSMIAMASQMQKAGRLNEAAQLLQQACSISPKNHQAALQLARLFYHHGQENNALSVLKRAVQCGAKSFELLYMLAALQQVNLDFVSAEKNVRAALQFKPESPEALNILGTNLVEQNRFEDAIEIFNQALQFNPDTLDVHNNLAWAYRAIGSKDEAIEHFSRAVELEPNATEALSGLLLLQQHKEEHEKIKLAERLSSNPKLPVSKRVDLEFALGKAFEDLKDYNKAFDYFERANTSYRKNLKYNISEDQALYDSIKAAFPDAGSVECQVKSDTELSHYPAPIFVLGMPRSSTSLVEQVLASHSQIAGAGELRILSQLVNTPNKGFTWKPGNEASLAKQYLSELQKAADTEGFVTDKMPGNFRHIGVILRLFPNAKIIHCRRQAMDTCLSLYKHHFPMAPHNYSYDLKELGEYYGLYEDLMQHWHNIAPGRIFDLQYETLIADFEPKVREMLDYLQLPFEQACLDFQNTKRVVRTASSDQVRRGLYQSGANQWQHYESQLQPLSDALK